MRIASKSGDLSILSASSKTIVHCAGSVDPNNLNRFGAVGSVNQQWTMTNKQSGLSSIFNGESPFNDGGQLETLDGHPEGAAIPNLPNAPQEFASGLDSELKSKIQNMSMNKSTKL